ncbi:MAG: alpha-2-macroglobulin family protein [Cellulophaga sp.]
MKHIIRLFIILLFSQMIQAQQHGDSYSNLWKKVEKLEKEALTKSALETVTLIFDRAKKEQNSVQTIKALLYTSKYALTLEENAQLQIVNNFKSEIKKSQFPTKNILESYLATIYWQYFQQNRYQFYNRTNTENKVDNVDFRTWDLTTIFKEISFHFDNSLKNAEGLQKEKLEAYNSILIQQKKSIKIRPTLYDLLAHTALNFYKTSENSITRPADKFEINDPDLLCETSIFIKTKINSNDITSLQLKALKIYQELSKFHSKDKTPYALVNVDIERIKFVYNNTTTANKNHLFLDVLKNSEEPYKNHEVSGLYSYAIATHYTQLANSYSPKTNEEHQWKNKEALALCDAVITSFPKSDAAQKSTALKERIWNKTLALTIEKHIPINTISKLLVSYKNHTDLEFTAYKIAPKEVSKITSIYPQKKQLSYIKKLEIAKQWRANLKNKGDYQTHSTEIKVPALSNGYYVVLATPKNNFYNTFAYGFVQTTNLALVDTETIENQIFQILNRNNGTPIEGAKLELSYQINYREDFIKKILKSDKMGMVKIPLSSDRLTNVSTSITHKEDTAYFGNYYIGKKSYPNAVKTQYNSFLFTDRSIYRPGQPLFFKGIIISVNENKSTVQTNTKVKITLRDVNRQIVSEQEFTTNEYGSVSGEFILPSKGLTGEFSLHINSKKINLNGRATIFVEEYKRPKFETSFNPITESYKVNDSVRINGSATAYAGSKITDAKVSYTVKRVVNYPKWYYWRSYYGTSSPQEIAHGETTTDSSGNYSILFKAIPDTSADKKNSPTFRYEITADVTDINGETHSTTTTVNIGYHTITAHIEIANSLDKDKKDQTLTISTTNLNDQSIFTKGKMIIYKLEAPKHVLRKRPWQAPDYSGFTKKEFKELFPHDAYKDEDNSRSWKKGSIVFKADFDTKIATKINLGNLKKWTSGKYIIELETKDKFGNEVNDIAETTVFSNTDKKLADNKLFLLKTNKDQYNIGDTVEITLFSNAKDVSVTVYVEKDKKITDTYSIALNENSKSFTIPVTKKDLGGFAINYHFSAYNSYVNGVTSISVPYPKTDLEIETVTFRDKLQPGTEEKWSFKIKGPKGEKVSAELLASMYDASLDTFRNHYWEFKPTNKPHYYSSIYSNAHQSFGKQNFNIRNPQQNNHYYQTPQFDSFKWFGFHFGYSNYGRTRRMKSVSAAPLAAFEVVEDDMEVEEMMIESDSSNLDEVITVNELKGKSEHVEKTNKTIFDGIQIRKNLQETAFFFPKLSTDKEGNISFSFTTPEALTKWKLQLLAHTKNLESTVTTLETVTQKELMVIPNMPRFLREGDQITFSSKIANLTDKQLSGIAKLELVDAISGKDISEKLLLNSPEEQDFKVDAVGNTQVSWTLKIPSNIQAVQYKVLARAEKFSDGEQNALPVLTNRMLITETLPMWIRSNKTKTFTLDKLKETTSNSLTHHKLSLEITSNPAWYAVQALPYLMEYPYECNEQTFSKYYANALASYIANSNPRIRAVFNQWANSDALLSNLEKNQELKSLLIQETPWLRNAQSETEQKKRIALLFNLNKMKNEQETALSKLKNNQMSSGAWAWFNGGRANRYITQHIISGLGHLKQLHVPTDKTTQQIIKNALRYLDAEFINEYKQMEKYTKNIKHDHLSHTQIHYLYMRSFFNDIPTSGKVEKIKVYYTNQAKKYWVSRSLYNQGLLALILNRNGEKKTALKILKSLKENSITSDELGMYWKSNTASWYWYQAPIETQALLIEAFGEIEKDPKTLDNLKIWLLKNKQTNQWKTTKATTEAVYALLLQGSDWLSVTDAVGVLIGGQKIESSKLKNIKVEAGTGYYKTSWNSSEISPKMAEVKLIKKGKGIAWGALYWQYFEDLDKITSAKTPLVLNKKLFLKKNTATGEVLSEITKHTKLKLGDLVRVRIELRTDRPMEFIHMKDMRAAGLEPISILSSYKWQDGLGYYESTKDASTNFFFDYLPKGIFVFEYDLRVNNAGNFSNGITTIQSMYAPEFSSHSEGIRIQIN